jgi:hypothetical protein
MYVCMYVTMAVIFFASSIEARETSGAKRKTHNLTHTGCTLLTGSGSGSGRVCHLPVPEKCSCDGRDDKSQHLERI